MKNNVLFIVFLIFLNISCSDNKHEEDSRELIFTVASVRNEKSNIEESPSYGYIFYIKRANSTKWESFPYEILNFNYEEGYEYIIRVKETQIKNPPQDAPSVQYSFIELINKEKKDSGSLPI